MWRWNLCIWKETSLLYKHFPGILQEILNCDYQRHDSEQGQGQSILADSSELKNNFRHGDTERAYTKTIKPRIFATEKQRLGLNVMVAFTTAHQRCFITIITMIKTPTWVMIQPQLHRYTTLPYSSAGKPHNCFGYADRRALQSETLIDHNFSHDNQHQKVYNPSLAFNHQVTGTCSDASLVTSVIV